MKELPNARYQTAGTRLLPGVTATEFVTIGVVAAILLTALFALSVNVVLIGAPDRDEATEALEAAMRTVGQDVQVIFRSRHSRDAAKDAFTRTAKSGPLVELELAEPI